MKEAIVYSGPKVEIVDSPIPKAGPGQVVTKIAFAASNPKDWKRPLYWGSKGTGNQGDEHAGVVYEVGEGEYEFKPGDRVAAMHEMKTPGGSYAEYGLSPAYTTFKLPDNTSFQEGAVIPFTALTAVCALYARLELPSPWLPVSDSTKIPLVIWGASSAVGSYAIQLAKRSNIHPLICITGRAQEYVESLIDRSKGDTVIDYRKGSDAVVQQMKDCLGDSKLDYAFDAISEGGSYQTICKVLDPTGKITLIIPAQSYSDIPKTITKSVTTVASIHENLKDFGYVFTRYFSKGLQDGWLKPHPQEVIPGGLEGIEKGLVNLENGAASAVKYVYKIADTPGRYCSQELSHLFSQRSRHSTWRKLWLYLAESEKELGIPTITDEALEQMRANLIVTDEDFETARVEEKIRRHDVMAHVHAFGQVAPAAAGIIHYGATSCYVTDNTELLLMRDALDLLIPKLAKVLSNLQSFALEWKNEPTLSFTHLQPAQISTVGKRAAAWAQDLLMDLQEFERVRSELKFRGAQGTTGTQASFLEIFGGDHDKCDKLNELLCQKAGFEECYDISTQTYTRKVDCLVANAVTGFGTSVTKIASDLRHLATMKEVGEPREKGQIGSSAMAYKQNPMRSERIASLARVLQGKAANFQSTHSTQWMERSLDDSACRRMDIPEMFLLADAITITLQNVTEGLVVFPLKIHSNIMAELPFMITENVIMRLVAMGVSRQEAHEQIRVLSFEASHQVQSLGKPNDMVERIKNTEFFKPIWGDLDSMMDPKLYIGRSAQLVDKFCGPGGKLDKKLQPYKEVIQKAKAAELNV
ncbi:adenylosuccinate lyase [Fusarium longipes]|uniref:Adenylosuccinate lyase n=1 Tax=Fusarium longipes TaxID=694270 RepID=A0A395T777_9HYPO|nr:adenylosuccinate lyase [Fusarium longipes]